MKSIKISLFLLCLVGGLNLVRAQPVVSVADDSLPSVVLPPEIDRVLRDYERAWQDKNAEALVALFTPGGFVMQPSRPPIRGHEGLMKAYQNSGGPLFLRALSFAQADTVAYIIGAYRYKDVGSDAGKFILALRRQPGERWMIAADMDNSIK